MNHRRRRLAFAARRALISTLATVALAGSAPQRLRLIENLGQFGPPELAFVGSVGGLRVGLHREGRLLLELPGEERGRGTVVALVFEDASPEVEIEGGCP